MMKPKLLYTALLLTLFAASCRSSREGCPSTNSSGPKYKAEKFSWYKGS